MIRRTLRIWPLYFLFVFIGFYVLPFIAKLLLGKIYTYASLPYFLLFLGNFAMKHVYELNDFSYIPIGVGTLWSVGVEEQFYIILALCFIILKVKQLKWLILALSAGGLIYILMPKAPGVVYSFDAFYYLLDFFAGAFLGYWATNDVQFGSKINANAKLLGGVIVALFIGVVFIEPLFSLKIVLIMWFSLLVCYLTFCNTSVTKKLQNARWIIYGGKISYGVYVVHPMVQMGFYILLNKYLPTSGQLYKDIIRFMLTSVCTFYIAHLLYKYFESFFLKLKERFY